MLITDAQITAEYSGALDVWSVGITLPNGTYVGCGCATEAEVPSAKAQVRARCAELLSARSSALKLTADTITDAQINALKSALLAEGHAGSEDVASCSHALPGSTRWEPIADWGESRPVPDAVRRAARARCADLLNERNGR